MIRHAVFALQGQEYMAIDSTVPHAFTFASSISIFVHCAEEAEIDNLYKKLSQSG